MFNNHGFDKDEIAIPDAINNCNIISFNSVIISWHFNLHASICIISNSCYLSDYIKNVIAMHASQVKQFLPLKETHW